MQMERGKLGVRWDPLARQFGRRQFCLLPHSPQYKPASPQSRPSQWFYGDTLFIIDVWLWALLIGAVWWGARREKAGGDQRPIAMGAIAVGLAYIGVNGAISKSTAYAGTPDRIPDQVISSPVPLAFWKREVLWREGDTWWFTQDDLLNGRQTGEAVQSVCSIDDLSQIEVVNSQLDAFLFWSRAPFAERAEDGSVILRDARFYDPRARDRFSIALPDAECEELTSP